mmetsp:Transcript_5747/g.7754  ORF Transcript_5747/g.7754 Transcript_5747/m.7754 type:complete len:218 (-) Transcript_5747:231-884(-)
MMLAAQCGYLIYLWSVKWVIEKDQPKRSEQDLYGGESWDFYKDYSLIAFIVAAVTIPLFGYLSDKIDMGNQLVLTFGIRCIASLAYFVIDSPHGPIVLFTLIVLKTSNPLQATVIESLFTKRLPGDVRAALQGVRGLFGNLGYAVCACMSLACVEYFEDIQRAVVFAALFDGSIVFFSAIIFVVAGFEEDLHSGQDARSKGKKSDDTIKEAEKQQKQ